MTINKIKKVSRKLFAEKGYEGTSLSDIASGVGIKKPSIYAHFSNKDDLFLAVFEDVFSKYVETINEAHKSIEDLSVDQKIYHLLHTTCKYSSLNQESILMFKRAILFPPKHLKSDIQAKTISFEKKQEEMLTLLFTEAIDQDLIAPQPIEQLLSSYYCILDGNVFHLVFYNKHHFEDRMMSIWKTYWRGLCAEKETRLRVQ